MKKSLLVRLHIYAGLFTCFYLIVFGFSTIVMNHKFNLEKTNITKSWKSEVLIDDSMSDRQRAENIRDQLGLMGWVPPWEYKKDESSFQFIITHPGRKYHVNTKLSEGSVEISEAPKGFVHLLHEMHFFNGNLPNAPILLRSWKIYQWTTLLVIGISLLFGLWIWIKNGVKKWEVVLFGGFFTASIIIMLTLL